MANTLILRILNICMQVISGYFGSVGKIPIYSRIMLNNPLKVEVGHTVEFPFM